MKKYDFLQKIHPIKRLEKLKNFDFSGEVRNDMVTTLSSSSKFICKKNCTVQPYVVIEGTVYCEKNVFIGPYSFLRGPLYLGENVHIGPYCEVTRCIVMKNSKITHKNIIPDAVIDENVWIAGGVIFCNTRLDLKQIKFKWKNNILKTDKFSTYVESNCNIGVSVITMPGTFISCGTTLNGPQTYKGK